MKSKKHLFVEVKLVNDDDWNDKKETELSVSVPLYYTAEDLTNVFWALTRNIPEEAFELPSEVEPEESDE